MPGKWKQRINKVHKYVNRLRYQENLLESVRGIEGNHGGWGMVSQQSAPSPSSANFWCVGTCAQITDVQVWVPSYGRKTDRCAPLSWPIKAHSIFRFIYISHMSIHLFSVQISRFGRQIKLVVFSPRLPFLYLWWEFVPTRLLPALLSLPATCVLPVSFSPLCWRRIPSDFACPKLLSDMLLYLLVCHAMWLYRLQDRCLGGCTSLPLFQVGVYDTPVCAAEVNVMPMSLFTFVL